MIEMLAQSRPERVELLPALPDARADDGRVRGTGVRGGSVLDPLRREGTPGEATPRSVGGLTTTVAHAGYTRRIRPAPGGFVTLRILVP
ncbi:hypothetical protein [Streptomyces sp. NPDC093598]|uniref:hypothetical protein n=1 Tax=Streptomyces sp. NPDC093598 TaxID=3366046 RepID=UPI0038040BA1